RERGRPPHRGRAHSVRGRGGAGGREVPGRARSHPVRRARARVAGDHARCAAEVAAAVHTLARQRTAITHLNSGPAITAALIVSGYPTRSTRKPSKTRPSG